MTSYRSLFALGIAALVLAACGDVKQDLGLGRSVPDEFAVVDRPPLSMPPDFSLRPPTPGAPRPQEVDLTQHASETLFAGASSSSGSAPSDAEKALLTQTGADKVDPGIRTTINREAAQKVTASDHLLQDLLWWKKDPSAAAVVDAPGEAQRLKEAKDKGEAPNAGATPIIERDQSSWLGL